MRPESQPRTTTCTRAIWLNPLFINGYARDKEQSHHEHSCIGTEPPCEDERKKPSYPFLLITTPKRHQIPFGRERASHSKRSRFEALTSKNSPGYGSGFPDLLYLKPPEHKDSKKDVKGGRSAYRLPTYLAIGQSSRLDRWFHKRKISVTLDLWGLSAATPVPRARDKSLLCMFILTLMLLFCFPHCALLLFPWQWYRSRCA